MLATELIKLYRWICGQYHDELLDISVDELGDKATCHTWEYLDIRNYICERLYCHENETATLHYC